MRDAWRAIAASILLCMAGGLMGIALGRGTASWFLSRRIGARLYPNRRSTERGMSALASGFPQERELDSTEFSAARTRAARGARLLREG